MSVTTKHPLYADYSRRWTRVRDVYDGEDVVKRKAERYLNRTGQQVAAKLSGATAEADLAYESYRDRAELPDIYAPSIIGLTGLATRVKWDIEIPKAMEYLWEDAGSGIPLAQMQAKLIQDGLKFGRVGHFPDTDLRDDKIRIALYDAFSIINWKHDLNRTSLVVLAEERETEESKENIFSHDKETHYRVLRFLDGKFVVEEHKPNDGDLQRTLIDTMSFQKDVLPFVFQGSTGLEPDPDMIPLEGMIHKVLKYYVLSADLYHDIHMSNTSTLFGKGFQKDDIKFAGSGAVIITSAPDADLKYVSTDGAGQDNAIKMMAAMIESAEKSSHRMTMATSSVEASSTLKQKTATKTATLRTVEEQAVMSLELDLKFIAMMSGLNPEQVSATSSYAYTDEQVDATLLTAISNATTAGNVPSDAPVEYLKSVGWYEGIEKDELIQQMEGEAEEREARALGMMQGEADINAGAFGEDPEDEEEAA